MARRIADVTREGAVRRSGMGIGRRGEKRRSSWKVKRGGSAPTGWSSSPTSSRRSTRSRSRVIRTFSPPASSPTRRAFGSKARPPSCGAMIVLPFAEFFIFDTRRAVAARPSDAMPGASPSFPLEESASAQRSLSSEEWRERRARREGRDRERRRLPGQPLAPDPLLGARRAVRPRARALRPEPRPVRRHDRDGRTGPSSRTRPSSSSTSTLGTGRAVTKPIKGTVARGAGPRADAEARAWLLSSAKDRAENVMITDLLRNDLGRVAIAGGVETTASPAPHVPRISTTSNPRSRRGSRRGRGCPTSCTRRCPAGRSRGRRSAPPSASSAGSSRWPAARTRAPPATSAGTAASSSTSRSGPRSSAGIQSTITREVESCGNRTPGRSGGKRSRSRARWTGSAHAARAEAARG